MSSHSRIFFFTAVLFVLLAASFTYVVIDSGDEVDGGYTQSSELGIYAESGRQSGLGYYTYGGGQITVGQERTFGTERDSELYSWVKLKFNWITSTTANVTVTEVNTPRGNWYLNDSGESTRLTVGLTLSLDENCRLNYIQSVNAIVWFDFEFTTFTYYDTTARITLDFNDGSTPSTSIESVLYDQTSTSGNVTLKLPSQMPVWDDHLFLGWATSTDGDPVYQPGQSVSIGKTVETTYYARWLSPGDTITATDLDDLVDYATVPDVTINLNLPADAELTEDVIVADGTDIIRVMDKTVTMNGHSFICQGESRIELKLNSQQSGYSRAFGEYELSGCFSIVPDGPYLRFDGTFSDTSTVILRNDGTLISGTLEGDMEFVNGSSVNAGTGVVFEDFTVKSGSTLELIGNDNVTYSSQGSFNLYGTLKDEDERDAILLEVDDGSTFKAYPGSSIDTVAVRAAEDSTAATVDTTAATIDLGIYTGGQNYSTSYETYSGIDCDMWNIWADQPFYVSYGATVRTSCEISASMFWFDGMDRLSSQDLGLSYHFSYDQQTDMFDIGIDGTVDEYGSAEFVLYHASGVVFYRFYCMEPMYTVSFDSNNGSEIPTQVIQSGDYVVMPDDPELYGYVFGGWFLDDGTFLQEFDFDSPVQGNIILHAKWNEDLRFTTDPIADGTVTSLDGQPGTVNFKATASKDYSSLVWDFGDGSTSTNTYVTHFYGQPGTYRATLTVFNNYGSDTTEFIIEVPEMSAGGGAMTSSSTSQPGFWHLSSGDWSSEKYYDVHLNIKGVVF